MPDRHLRPIDFAVAALFTIAAQLEMWLLAADQPTVAQAMVAGVATVSLAWRRLAPLAVAALVPACALAITISGRETGDLVLFAGMLLAAFSYGAYARGALVRPVVVGAWLVGEVGLGLFAGKPNEILGMAVLLAGAFAGGRALTLRGAAIGALEDRAARLEREQEQRARAAVLEERARIARELHDIVAHSVSVMVLQTGAGRQLMRRDADRATALLTSVESTGRQALAEMKRLVGIMREDDARSTDLSPQPGMDDVDDLVERARATGREVVVRVEGDPVPLPAGLGLTAYRVLQEALTNSIKHAQDARVDVRISYLRDAIELEVTDDGPGPAAAPGGAAGHGLVGMRERVGLYGGQLETGAVNGCGFAVRARLPLDGTAP